MGWEGDQVQASSVQITVLIIQQLQIYVKTAIPGKQVDDLLD